MALSRLVHRKGIDLLAVVVCEICRRQPDLCFVIGAPDSICFLCKSSISECSAVSSDVPHRGIRHHAKKCCEQDINDSQLSHLASLQKRARQCLAYHSTLARPCRCTKIRWLWAQAADSSAEFVAKHRKSKTSIGNAWGSDTKRHACCKVGEAVLMGGPKV